MATFKFLHAADLHLDSPLRGLSRRLDAAGAFVGASRRAFENLVEAAIREKVAFLVIAGDVYDGDWRDYATGHFFVRQMGRLAAAQIRVFMLRGNHDAESVITRKLPAPENVHDFSTRAAETVTLGDLSVALHGRGFANRHVGENVALAYPQAARGHFNIGVLHTSLTGREGHDVYAPCTVEDLQRAGYDYWALGHVHRREVVSQQPFIVFPGNLQGRHARETGPKGATLVHVAEGRVVRLEALALDAARFEHVEVDLSGAATRAEFHERARRAIAAAHAAAEGRPLALRVTLVGETPLSDYLLAQAEQVREDLQALASGEGAHALLEKLRNETRARGARAILAGFEEILAEASADPAFREEVARTLEELRSKAPHEAQRLLRVANVDPKALADAAIAAARVRVVAALNGEAER